MAQAARPFWLAGPSRYAGLARKPARIAAALLALLLVVSFSALWSATPPANHAEAASHDDDQRDVVLYTNIVAALRHGEPYYAATAQNLRAGGYPLRPFVTFRLPTLALVQSRLPVFGILALLYTLVAAVALTWVLRLRAGLAHWRATVIATALLAGGLMAFVQAELWPFHEVWAGLLVAWSLGLRRPGRYVEAAAIGLIAALVRETAGLYLLVMALLAWRDGAKGEARAWCAAILGLGVALVAHAVGVSRVVNPLDLASPGWAGLLGPGFFVNAIRASTALAVVPLALAAPLVALALFGWSAWRDALALRVTVTLASYALVLCLFARADTFYWALMIAPLFLVGLAFAPDGLRDLVASNLDKRRITVTRVTR
jgi:hypothetical protein